MADEQHEEDRVDRLILEKTVRLEGPTFWGKYSCLMLEPAPSQDWVWNCGGYDVPITPDIMVAERRRVALVYKNRVFNEFEHVGILRAAGLRGVRVTLLGVSKWPPYDGSSFGLWQAVIPHVRKSGELQPYRPFSDGRLVTEQLSDDKSRSTQYSDTGRRQLDMTGYINFAGVGGHFFGQKHPDDDLLPLVRARTLGWPRALWPLARLAGAFGWPHYWHILWPQDVSKVRLLEETGQHRLLDMLAILNFAAPADAFLTGMLNSCKGNHATDLGLLKRLSGAKVLTLRPAA